MFRGHSGHIVCETAATAFVWPLKDLMTRMFVRYDWTNSISHSLNVHDLPSASWGKKKKILHTIIGSLILSVFFQRDKHAHVKLTIYVQNSVSGFEIDDIRTVTDTVLEIQHLGNISLGKLFLTNLMTLWYQWSVSKLGQLPKLVGQLTSSIFTSPTTALRWFYHTSFPWACTDPTF